MPRVKSQPKCAKRKGKGKKKSKRKLPPNYFHQQLNARADELGLWERPREETLPAIIECYREFASQEVSTRIALQTAKHVVGGSIISRAEYMVAAVSGLWKAAMRYDHHQPARFTTYARNRVRGEMIDLERSADWIPAKARSADKARIAAGEPTQLPIKSSLTQHVVSGGACKRTVALADDGWMTSYASNEQFDRNERAQSLYDLIDECDPQHAEVLQAALQCDSDLSGISEILGTDTGDAAQRYRAALAHAFDIAQTDGDLPQGAERRFVPPTQVAAPEGIASHSMQQLESTLTIIGIDAGTFRSIMSTTERGRRKPRRQRNAARDDTAECVA